MPPENSALRLSSKWCAVIVAADSVGAGVGELILYAAGSLARQTVQTKDRPVDHVVMAIIDQIEVDGSIRYDKMR